MWCTAAFSKVLSDKQRRVGGDCLSVLLSVYGCFRERLCLMAVLDDECTGELMAWMVPLGKVVPYRDTGSVEPGSRPFFGSVSGSQSQFLGIDNA